MTAPSLASENRGTGAVDLSVLFVTRNEEKRIEACIRSAMDAVDEARRAGVIRSAEFLLVDSASTDRTVEIASRFPVEIVSLEPHWPLSCGAGCFVGLNRANGEYTAIVNGDMVIDRRWFADVLPYVRADVAGVCGVATEELPGRTVVERAVRRFSSVPLSVGTLPPEIASHPGGYSTGTFLIRTRAARGVGSYNPFFRAAEDMDLRFRLLRAGWKVLNVPVYQGTHFWSSEGNPLDIGDYARTIMRNSVGLGQMARYNSRRDAWVARQAFRQSLNARALLQASVALLGGSLVALVLLTLATVRLEPGLIAASGIALLFGGAVRGARRKRLAVGDYVFAEFLLPGLFVLLRTLGFLRGYGMAPRGPKDYPTGARASKG